MQKVLLACSMFFFLGVAHAQAQDSSGIAVATPSSSGQAPNDAVGVHLAPGLRGSAGVGLQALYNSNFYLTPENPKSSFGFVLTPNVLLVREAKKIRYELGGGLEAAKFTDVSIGPDNYLDGNVAGKFDWAALTRHRFSADFNTRYSHDQFGAYRTETGFNANEDLDKWLETNVNGRYRFGAPGALINLETEAGWIGRHYETNRDQTEFLDYRIWHVRETAYFNVSSKTSLIAEVVRSDIGYYHEYAGAPTRDSTETRYRAGIHWIATGTTTGDLRIGRLHRDFDNPDRQDLNSFDWLASVSWAPQTYSVFTLQTGNQTQQSYLAGVQLIQNRFGVIDWTHDYSNYFRTRLAYSRVNSQFVGSSRVDNIDTFALEANYLATKRLIGTAGASYSRRNSNVDERDYSNTAVYLGVRYTR